MRKAPQYLTDRFGKYLDDHIIRSRQNKTARGLSFTQERQRKMKKAREKGIHTITEHERAVLKLLVHGTCDKLAGFFTHWKANSVCSCCGHKTGKLRLTDEGRKRLNRLRRTAIERAMRQTFVTYGSAIG